MSRLTDAISGTRNKLARVRKALFKRRARVAFCKSQQQLWVKRMQDADKHGWTTKGAVAEKKVAYWHELLDKAILGKKDFEKRQANLEKKVAILKKAAAKEQAGSSYPDKVVVPDEPWNPRKLPLPGWIAERNNKVWASGLRFELVSGFRTPQYSESLCINMCGHTTCPGRCAGRSTNHSCPPTYTGKFPEGAEDVTNYYEFRARLIRLGINDLKNDLPIDRVHFSYSGH